MYKKWVTIISTEKKYYKKKKEDILKLSIIYKTKKQHLKMSFVFAHYKNEWKETKIRQYLH